MIVEIVLASLWGYVLGAIPTGVVMSRVFRGGDVRQSGSGHTGGLNVARQAGLWAGVLTALIDFLLGLGAVAGVSLLTDNPWAATAAGVMAVVGHDWSIFIRFGGGIGMAKLTGALVGVSFWVTVLALVTLIVLWGILVKGLRVHRARATILAIVCIGPLLWALGLSLPGILLGILGGVVVIVKTLPDWNRQYE